jgi:hypothetical protein
VRIEILPWRESSSVNHKLKEEKKKEKKRKVRMDKAGKMQRLACFDGAATRGVFFQ